MKWDRADEWFRRHGELIEILEDGSFKVVSSRGNIVFDDDKYRAIEAVAHLDEVQRAVEKVLGG